MAARITREFLDRMRDDPDFLEATPGDASEAVAIIDLAISALSHPAALERARAEERERCAMVPTYRAQDLRAIISGPAKTHATRFPEFAHRAEEADGIAAAIRALGPVPRPSPETEPISTTAESVLHRVMEQAERDLASAHAAICKLQGIDPATHEWPSWSPQANTLRWFAHLRRDYPAASTPPALAPELRERLVGFLMRAQLAFRTGDGLLDETNALLSALSPQTDGGAK